MKVGIYIVACLVCASCNVGAQSDNKSPLANAVDEFSKGLSGTREMLLNESVAQTKVRRMLAAAAFIRDPTQSGPDEVFVSGNIRQSLRTVACIGLNETYDTEGRLAWLGQFETALKGIVKEADGSLGAQWRNLRDLQRIASGSKQVPGPLASSDAEEVNGETPLLRCRAAVDKAIGLIENKSTVGSIIQKEAVPFATLFALGQAVWELAQTVEALAVDILKIANEEARYKAVQRLLEERKEELDKALAETGDDILAKAYRTAWEARQASTLVIPYYRVRQIVVEFKPANQPLDLVRTAEQLHDDLADFDAMRLQVPPDNLLKAAQTARQKLKKVVSREQGWEADLAYLFAFAKRIKQIGDDYDKYLQKRNSLMKAVKEAQQ